MISGIIPFGDEYHTSSPDSFSLCICNNSSLLFPVHFNFELLFNFHREFGLFWGRWLVDVYIIPHPVNDFFGYGFFRVTRSFDLVEGHGGVAFGLNCEECLESTSCVWIKL